MRSINGNARQKPGADKFYDKITAEEQEQMWQLLYSDAKGKQTLLSAHIAICMAALE